MLPLEAFRTRTHRQVLRVLTEENRRYQLSELADLCHRSEAQVSRVVSELEEYTFIEKEQDGAGFVVVGLAEDSRYASRLRQLYRTEDQYERQETVPVDIWNFLEQLRPRLAKEIDPFEELFLFGSFATGNYHAGSDIDLFVLASVENSEDKFDTKQTVQNEMQNIIAEMDPPRETQVIVEVVKASLWKLSSESLIEKAHDVAPIQSTDKMIPIGGAIRVT